MLFFSLCFGLVGRHSVGLKVILSLFGFILFAPLSIEKGYLRDSVIVI